VKKGYLMVLCLTGALHEALYGLPTSGITEFFKNYSPGHDIIVNGTLWVKKNDDALYDARYNLAKKIVSKYKRSVTVADIGAELGALSSRLAQNYDAVCVMVESGEKARILRKACALTKSPPKNLILLKAPINHRSLTQLGLCEHFDIVLAFTPLQRSIQGWRRCIDDIINLGELILLEVPLTLSGKQLSTTDMVNYIVKRNGKLLGIVESALSRYKGAVYGVYRRKNRIKSCKWHHSKPLESHAIISDFDKKLFRKKGSDRPWQPGISLMTFRVLHGVYPSQRSIFKQLERMSSRAPKGSTVIVQGHALSVLP
jgi:hypothetical protein